MSATSDLGDSKNDKDTTKVNTGSGGESDQVRSRGHDDTQEDDGRAVGVVKEEVFNAELHARRSLLDEERCEDPTAPDTQLTGELGSTNLFSKSEDLSVLLPEELVLKLFEILPPADVLSSSQSCRLWRKLGENDKLWQKKCKEAGLVNRLNSADVRGLKRRAEISQIQYSASKLNFRKPFIVSKKFRTGVPQEITVELTLVDGLVVISNDKIVYCPAGFPADQTLYVYSLLDGELLRELVGHNDTVTSIQMNVHNGSCLHTLLGHTLPVSCLEIHGNIAVSGSYDRTLRMWDLLEGTCLRVLTGHTGRVRSVQYDGKLVVSVSTDRSIKVWDAATGECLQTQTGVCSYTITAARPDKAKLQGDMLASLLYNNGPVQIRRASTGDILHTLVAVEDDPYKSIEINDRFVVTGSEKGTIKLWDIKTGELIRVLVEEKDGLGSVWMTEQRIVYEVVPGNEPEGARPIQDRLVILNFDTNDEDYDMGHVEK